MRWSPTLIVGCPLLGIDSLPIRLEHESELLEIFESGFAQSVADGRQAAVMRAALELPKARAGVTRSLLAKRLPKLIADSRR